jgi:hypothetical protein
VIAAARDGRRYVWAAHDSPEFRASKGYIVLSQPSGIQQVVTGPTSRAMLVWDGKGQLAARTVPQLLPWPLQLPSTVTSMCSGGQTFAAALTSGGELTVGGRSGGEELTGMIVKSGPCDDDDDFTPDATWKAG